MSLERLTYFVDAVYLASFTAAAQKNFVSQTAISKQMKNLEDEIGTPVIHPSEKPRHRHVRWSSVLQSRQATREQLRTSRPTRLRNRLNR